MNFESITQTESRVSDCSWWESQRSRLRRDLVFLNRQVRLLSLLVRRPEVPWPAKVAGGCAIAYIFSPIQLIPSFILVIGQLDDLLILFLGTKVVRKFTPDVVLNECEARAECASSAQVEHWEHRFLDSRQNPACDSVNSRRKFLQNACQL